MRRMILIDDQLASANVFIDQHLNTLAPEQEERRVAIDDPTLQLGSQVDDWYIVVVNDDHGATANALRARFRRDDWEKRIIDKPRDGKPSFFESWESLFRALDELVTLPGTDGLPADVLILWDYHMPAQWAEGEDRDSKHTLRAAGAYAQHLRDEVRSGGRVYVHVVSQAVEVRLTAGHGADVTRWLTSGVPISLATARDRIASRIENWFRERETLHTLVIRSVSGRLSELSVKETDVAAQKQAVADAVLQRIPRVRDMPDLAFSGALFLDERMLTSAELFEHHGRDGLSMKALRRRISRQPAAERPRLGVEAIGLWLRGVIAPRVRTEESLSGFEWHVPSSRFRPSGAQLMAVLLQAQRPLSGKQLADAWQNYLFVRKGLSTTITAENVQVTINELRWGRPGRPELVLQDGRGYYMGMSGILVMAAHR